MLSQAKSCSTWSSGGAGHGADDVVAVVVVVWWWCGGGGDLAVAELQLIRRDGDGALLAARSGAAARGGLLAGRDVLAGCRAHDQSWRVGQRQRDQRVRLHGRRGHPFISGHPSASVRTMR